MWRDSFLRARKVNKHSLVREHRQLMEELTSLADAAQCDEGAQDLEGVPVRAVVGHVPGDERRRREQDDGPRGGERCGSKEAPAARRTAPGAW